MRKKIERRISVSACLALSLSAGTVWSAGVGDTIVVHTSQGVATFLVENANVGRAAASRVNADMAGKDGVAPPPTPGYELTSKVVVRGTRQAMNAALGRLRAPVIAVPVEGAPSYVNIEAGTIAEAAALAASLRGAGFKDAVVDVRRPMPLRSIPTDPGLAQQWHLINGVTPVADANIEGAWNLGYTGQGVTIGILEGGFETGHEDLSANYHAAASQSGGSATSHGTACAGVAGAGVVSR